MFEKQSYIDIIEMSGSDQHNGLSAAEARERLSKNGPNAIEEKKAKTKLRILISQLTDPMIYILFAAAVISLFLHEYNDGAIILTIIIFNAIIGGAQEFKAEKSLEALKKLSSPYALVRRGGVTMEIPAAELVTGDIVLLEAGRIVPADLRLISCINLQIEESSLTGESVPVQKDADFIAVNDTAVGDRVNMAYLSTHVIYGRGEGIVVSTGMKTEIGRIAEMINETSEEMTPLQKKLGDLGKVLGMLAVVLCLFLFIIAVLQGRDIMEMLITAISLAVAAIPEGLPAVVTIVLALGVQKMVRLNAIVRKLPAVETLGAVSIVCSDKTGTLTQNKMTVVKIYLDHAIFNISDDFYIKNKFFTDGFILCTDAQIDEPANLRLGDPTELALLDFGIKFRVYKNILENESPRINEHPFDSKRKMMTTVHKNQDGKIISYTKGAVDIIIDNCTEIIQQNKIRTITSEDKEKIKDAAGSMAANALRVLALACKNDDDSASEKNLIFVGLAGLADPPRPEASVSVQILKNAGIRTVMITGDHKDTAFAIAKELQISDAEAQCITGDTLNKMSQDDLNKAILDLRVFARVSPEHKVMIVNAFKSHGHIVSMTGDGVNDAPSLKAADIGVAMGISGTDVARGAADIILTDDNFATIEKAIEEGRKIYGNITKTVLYLLSSNLAEIITMFFAITVGLASPLKAIHILWINLITDSMPALALGVDPGDRDLMKESPRDPRKGLFADGAFAWIIFLSTAIGASALAAFIAAPVFYLCKAGTAVSIESIRSALSDPIIYLRSQTYAFTTMAVCQLFHAIGMRNLSKSLFKFNFWENRMMITAFFIGVALQAAVTEIHYLTAVFGVMKLSTKEWFSLLALSTVPLWFHEFLVFCKFAKEKWKRK